MPQVIARDLSNFPPFMPIDRCLRRLYVVRRARLNLNETKDIAVPADEVNFSPMAGRPVVSGNHDVTKPAQIEIGVFLTASACLLMLGAVVGGKGMRGHPIETPNEAARNRGWKHGTPSLWQ